MPWTKEEKKEYDKKYRQANKDKIKEYMKEYFIENKEKVIECNKKYYLENKEKQKLYCKKYRETNKEKVRECEKKYNKTENGKKNRTINKWITKYKIKFADRNEAEFYYNTYINTNSCTWCNIQFKDSRDRNLDHCHTCGLPRAIICRECNTKDLVPCVNCLL